MKKRDVEFGYFFRLVYNKNLPIFVLIFKNHIFRVKHNKNLSILADFFLVGGRTAVRSR